MASRRVLIRIGDGVDTHIGVLHDEFGLMQTCGSRKYPKASNKSRLTMIGEDFSKCTCQKCRKGARLP